MKLFVAEFSRTEGGEGFGRQGATLKTWVTPTVMPLVLAGEGECDVV